MKIHKFSFDKFSWLQKVLVQSQKFPQLIAAQVDCFGCVVFLKVFPLSSPFCWNHKVAGKRSSGGWELLQVFSSWSWIVSTFWISFVAEFPLSLVRERQLWNIRLSKSSSSMRSFCLFAKFSFKVHESFLAITLPALWMTCQEATFSIACYNQNSWGLLPWSEWSSLVVVAKFWEPFGEVLSSPLASPRFTSHLTPTLQRAVTV